MSFSRAPNWFAFCPLRPTKPDNLESRVLARAPRRRADQQFWVPVAPASTDRPERHDCALLIRPRGVRIPVRSDEAGKRRVEQITGLPFAFELAVA